MLSISCWSVNVTVCPLCKQRNVAAMLPPDVRSGAEAPGYYANERTTTKRKVAEAKLTVPPVSFWNRKLTVSAALT